jgi:indolepyruvate decarboxylase
VADAGDVLFGATDLYIHRRTEFLGAAYYTSMGFAVPASIGVQLANPRSRALVLVGDGAFQMTGMELSTSVRYGLNPIVVVFNNAGYGTERPMQDGPYNDIATWQFHRLPDVFGSGRSFLVKTEDELDRALREAHAHRESFALIEVKLDPHDQSHALQRLTERLGKRI